MEQHRDERIVCVGCGTSFLFSAAEAAHYAERGLAAPPKRCKECRRARKEQRERGELPRGDSFRGDSWRGDARRGDQPRPMNGRFGGRGDARGNVQGNVQGDGRSRMPADTGNVNEYRSPMQDGFRPPAVGYGGAGGFPARGRPRGRAFGNNDGNYRAPAFQDRGEAPRQGGRGGGRPRSDARPSSGGPAPVKAEPRTRPMFSITCKSCGAESQVPFKPDEGRDVFCQACYRARKPA
jgi:CxxC-x17-CxxC domain-containing protein